MRFRFAVVGFNDSFIRLCGFVKLAFQAKIVCAIEQIRNNFIFRFRQRLLRSAVFANGNAFAVFYLQRAAAHFALKYGHFLLSLFFLNF